MGSLCDLLFEVSNEDRLLFGSNATDGIPRIGLMVFEYTRLTEEEKKLATGKNLARLLGL